jgi:hypothetical protein
MNKKIASKKLSLSRETLRQLGAQDLSQVRGGLDDVPTETFSAGGGRNCTGKSCKSCGVEEHCD